MLLDIHLDSSVHCVDPTDSHPMSRFGVSQWLRVIIMYIHMLNRIFYIKLKIQQIIHSYIQFYSRSQRFHSPVRSFETLPEVRVGQPSQEILVGFVTAPPALVKAYRPPRKSRWVDPSRRSWLGSQPRLPRSPKRADRPGNPGGSTLPGDPGWVLDPRPPRSQKRADRPGNPGGSTLPGDPGWV